MALAAPPELRQGGRVPVGDPTRRGSTPYGGAVRGGSDGDGRPAHWLFWKEQVVDGRPAMYGEGGEGPTVVFLHGWGLTHRVYKRALSRLVAAGLHVVAPAMPGFGGTPPMPADDSTLAGYGNWVLAFLRAVGIDRPVLLAGHSFGGGVAIQTAYDHPATVHGLVLVNSIGGSAWTRSGTAVRSMASRPLWDWGLHVPADLWPLRQMRRVVPVLVGEAGLNLLREPRTFWRTAGIARRSDLTGPLEELKRRRLPVVVLWSNRDQIVTRASFEAMCEALGGVDAITVEASHAWLISDPDAFGEVMTNVVNIAEMAAAAKRHHRIPSQRP